MPSPILLTIGSRFGQLTVISERITNKTESSYLCRCDCGSEKQYRARKLTTGWSTSCGCKRKKTCSERMKKVNATHGMTYTPEWKSWDQMRRRCRENHKSRKDYFDRGITVHPALLDFQAFLAEIGPCPGEGYTVERKNNNLGYEPGNIRWATAKEQARNRRSTRLVTHNGKTQCIAAWAEELGMPPKVLACRIARDWPTNRAFYEPILVRQPHLN
jgi:hypothetical protein